MNTTINMNIIFNIQGGLGKNILATAVLEAIRKKYKTDFILVVCGYKEVFLNNPHANKVITHHEQNGIYRNFIQNAEVKFFTIDPYTTDDYLNERDSLIKIWCDLCNVPYNGETPNIYLSKAEKQIYAMDFFSNKPILTIQTNGGAPNQPVKYNWSRDIPPTLVEKIIKEAQKKYTIWHIRRFDQPAIPNVNSALANYRNIALLISISHKLVLIDSFAQHMAAALKKPAHVLWIGTSPKVFGYDLHTNHVAEHPDGVVNYEHPNYQKFNLVEEPHHMPYTSLDKIFAEQKIVREIFK